MPLTMAYTGENSIIKKIGGNDKTKQFLNSLGFNLGTEVKVINSIDGNLIVQIKESRVALSKELAVKISI